MICIDPSLVVDSRGSYFENSSDSTTETRKLRKKKKHPEPHNYTMQKAIVIILSTIIAVEAAAIIIGNTFTIFVFWTQRLRLKRAHFLLINLAIADLLVGVADVVVLVRSAFLSTEMETGKTRSPWTTLHVLGSSTSVFFLALISLERVYAVLWPLRHRMASNRVYIYTVVFVWVVGLCLTGISLLSMFHPQVDSLYTTAIESSLLFISLLIICTSYLTIRSRLHSTTPEVQIHVGKSTDQNLRLSRTFYIVVAFSLLFWLPAFVVYTIKIFCWNSCFSPIALWFVYVLQMANSMVNPFVYAFRMSIFKDALSKYWRRKRQPQNIELRVAPFHIYK